MCGLNGILFDRRWCSSQAVENFVSDGAVAIRHRGPDSRGEWIDGSAGVAFGHRRLAILDLSPEGHQPMHSTAGRFTVVYNGEIYNFRSLRRELEGLGHVFRGGSDTEVMIASLEQWGLDRAVRRFAGMFVIACWDHVGQQLHLVRDRLGKKPLYILRTRHAILFASELKAFQLWHEFRPRIDRRSLTLYLRHNYVPSPLTIYEDAWKLPPATILSLTSADLASAELPLDRCRTYWSAREVAEAGQSMPLRLGEEEAATALEEVLKLAVGERMIADVPLGAFLSGGVDSSTVVALMQAQSTRPVRTFTIGFTVPGYNEAEHARSVARHIGTEHTELYVSPDEAQAVIPLLPTIYDEPFGDPSQIPTYLVAELARRHVTVALSGDGGDETFGGYNRHFQAMRLARLRVVPRSLRRIVASTITAVSPPLLDSMLATLGLLMAGRTSTGLSGDRLHKLADVLDVDELAIMYRRFVSHWEEPASVVINGHEPQTMLTDVQHQAKLSDFQHFMMWLDTVTYLPDDILVKLDRATMAVSLEARCPLLDHRVVELGWRLPLSLKVQNGEGKRVLRRVLERYVPRPLIERPKMGFGVPIAEWLRGPLRDWADDLLAEPRLRRDGFFQSAPIRNRWLEHKAGTRNWSYHLWNVLMFQAWNEHWHGGQQPHAAVA
jgi:asparagine synthase (glutamine-hydrolysing)